MDDASPPPPIHNIWVALDKSLVESVSEMSTMEGSEDVLMAESDDEDADEDAVIVTV